jgi:DNA polymerase-3 subunit alpha
VENTVMIAKRCSVMSPKRKPILPRFGDGSASEDDQLREQGRAGLKYRLENYVFTPDMTEERKEELRKEYGERLEFELDVICKMQFPGYFLIVSDFIKWSKEHDIPVGPGRGSGAGSLVAWALLITDLDPLRYGLLFERFLNPERVSMPDFDVDFCQDRRGEVISYVQQKYGRDQVAQIITFGTLQARAALRDVGRVLQLPYGMVDRTCKLVPANPANPVKLAEAIEIEPLLKEAIKSDEQISSMVDIALKLEGLYRHASVHAAGVVIADRPLHQLVPIYRDPNSDMPVVQYSMKYAEMAGLVKFDFLGLKTLSVLQQAVKFVARKGIELDLLKLPEGDVPTYELLGKGEAAGVFQLESAGMRDTLRKLKPDCIEDIIALVSLYRPGPMNNIPTYIARKHGHEFPTYPHKDVKSILEETYGVIIYQEQVMQIAQKLAGYSLGDADLLRRAMGKKIREEMEAQRGKFTTAAVERGVDKSVATGIFDLMAKFAEYGFNKSHAAAYALIAYQTAFLKANHPVEFLAASMNYDAHNTDKLAMFREEANKMGIALLTPDVNKSHAIFEVEMQPDGERAIRYGLGAVRNVGAAAMEAMVAEREANGPFKDMFDFAERVDSKVLNRRQMEHLIKAGAFDSIMSNRKQLMLALDMILAHGQAVQRDKESQQVSLFGDVGDESFALARPSMPQGEDWRHLERLENEFEAIGFYLSAHPISDYQEALSSLGVRNYSTLSDTLGESYTPVTLAGIVMGKKVRVSDRGRFAFLSLSDPTGLFEVAIYDENILNTMSDLLENGQLLVINGDGKCDESGPRLVVRAIQPMDKAIANAPANRHAARGDAGPQRLTVRVRDEAALKALRNVVGEPEQRGMELRLELQLAEGKIAVMKVPGHWRLSKADIERLPEVPGILAVRTSA